jgi:hypothetical protein
MGLALQLPEHDKGIVGVQRFLQQIIAQQYDGVGTEDQVPSRCEPCPAPGVPHTPPGFPRRSLLFDVRRPNLDRNAEHLEQLTAPGRGGGEDEGGA